MFLEVKFGDQVSIKVITSNIRFDTESDGDNSWNQRKDFLAKTLLSKKSLIIGTQEGRRPQLEELHKLLPQFKLIDSHRDWIEERMYPCIFVHDSVTVLESGDFWLSNTPQIPASKLEGSAFPRLCTWVKLTYSDNVFYAFNLHLDHVDGDVRHEQSKILIREVSNIVNDHNFFLFGDFNASPESKVYEELTQKFGLKDFYS